jgi:tetratricopeptide (TPR) repeat protein
MTKRPPNTRRQLNTKLLAVLFFGTIFLAVGGFFLHRHMVARSADNFLTQAEKAEENQELEKALENYSRYLRYNPTATNALANYGMLLDKYGLSLDQSREADRVRANALPVFEKVLLQQPGNVEVRKALVALVVAVAKTPEQYLLAVPHIERLIKEADRKTDAKPEEMALLYGQRGKIYEGEKKYTEAAEMYAKAIEANPKQFDFYLPRAVVLRRHLNNNDEADKVVDALVENNADNANAYIARAGYRLAFKQPGAREDAAAALKRDPHGADALLTAAAVELDAFSKGGDADKARGWLQDGIKRYPKRKEMYLVLADLELRSRHIEAAEKALAQGVEQVPDSNDLAWYLTNTYIDNNQRTKADEMIKRFKGLEFPMPLVNLAEARVLVADGQWKNGLDALLKVRPSLDVGFGSLPPVQADMDLARCYRQLNRGDDDAKAEIAAYYRVLAVDANNTLALLNLSTALSRQGKTAEALQVLRNAGSESADTRLMQVRIMAGEIMRQPANQRNWAPVTQQLDALEQALPDTLALLILRAEVDLAQGQIDQARQRLQAARTAHPERLELWLAEAQVDQQIDQLNDALALLEEADRKFGPQPDLFLARLQFWNRRNDPIARQALVNMLPRLRTLPAERQDGFAEILAHALGRAGAAVESLALMKSVAQKLPDNLRVQSGLFDVAVLAGDDTLTREAIAALRRIEGDNGTQWRFGEASQIVAKARRENDRSHLAEAKKRLEEIRTIQRSKSPRVSILEADIAKIEGNPERAIAALTQALEDGERNPNVIRELVQFYYDEKRYDEADEAIRKLAQQGPLDTELKRLAAQVSVQARDGQEAIRMANEAVSPDSKDYRDQIWLGQMRTAVSQNPQAEQAFQKAVELAPNKPEPYLALAQFFLRTDRRADAERALERAKTALPADTAALALARGYKILGRNDLSEGLFEKALAAKPNDPSTLRTASAHYINQGRIDRAEPLLRLLIDPKAELSDRLWARRALAIGLLEAAVSDRFKEALDLVEANLSENPASLEDQHTRALVLTTFPARRKEAIELLEQLSTKLKNNGQNDRLVLAQLYDAEDQWPKAKQAFQELIAANPESPKHLIAFLKALVKHQEFDEANQYLQKLEGQKYSSLQLLGLKASILNSQGQTDKAVEQVRDFAKANPAQAKGCSELLERLGDFASAETLLKEQSDQKEHPDNLLALAAFYGRQNRPLEAIDLCDAARKSSLPLPNILDTAFSALGVTQPSAELLHRIESWIDEAERADGKKDAYRNQRGLLWTIEGRFKDAEALYRKAIDTNSADVMALNNLAWLLALSGGDADEALRLIDRAIGAVGYYYSLLDTRAVIQLARHQPDLALTDIKRVLKERNKDPIFYFHLARILHAANDKKGALDALNAADSLGLKLSDIDSLERNFYNALVAELKPEPAK